MHGMKFNCNRRQGRRVSFSKTGPLKTCFYRIKILLTLYVNLKHTICLFRQILVFKEDFKIIQSTKAVNF